MNKFNFHIFNSNIPSDPYSKQKSKRIKLFSLVAIVGVVIVTTRPLENLKQSYEYKISHPKELKLYPVPTTTTSTKSITTSKSTSNTTTKYIKPANGQITSQYGYRIDPISGQNSFHTGVDISCYTHRDNILAVADGVVTFAGSQNGYGNCIEIKHDFNGEIVYSFYAHLSKINVRNGQTVSQGDVIGNEGGDPYSDPSPGYSTGHHLHFELRTASGYGNHINPNIVLK